MRSALARGLDALSKGRPDEAAAQCRQVLHAFPKTHQAHFLVGLVALEKNDRRTAASAFGSVTRLEPSHAAAWAHLSRLFMLSGQARRADQALDNAKQHEHGDPMVQDLIGAVCSLLGDQAAAHTWYSKAVAAQPKSWRFRVNLANSLVFLGETSRAVQELTRVLAAEPSNAQAHWLLASARRARDRSHIEEMVNLMAKEHPPPQALAFLFYGLGKELEDLEEWPRAFEAFKRGAAARRQIVSYDEDAEIAAFDAAIETFTEDWFDQDDTGDPDQSPIFIVGQPRTGTTLVERIVTSHSMVHSAGELQQFGLSIRRLASGEFPGRFNADLVKASVDLNAKSLGEAYLKATEPVRGDLPRFVDKLPGNFFYLPLILKALPNAKIVHLVRAPEDACFASFKQLFAEAYPHSYTLEEMARHFVRYHRLMDVWRQRFGGRFLDVSYEQLVADLEPNARRLIDFLELPWEDACLAFHEASGAVATASAAQVREPAHTRSVGRWRRYENELAPMVKILADAGVTVAH
ncbi:MAG: sulfotransferase [Gammaproteobacteria bacterium]|nr:sulfotransferase [Gammaproteobacteria bacterium]